MDGMPVTEAQYDDIVLLINNLQIKEVTREYLLQLIQEKQNGNREAGDDLCMMGKLLLLTKDITPEQYGQIMIFARSRQDDEQKRLIITFARRRNGQGGGRPSGSGLPEMWKKLKQWLRGFFSLE